MNIVRIIYKSAVSPVGVITSEQMKQNSSASFVVVALTSVFGSIIAPVSYYLYSKGKYDISLDVGGMALMLCVSLLTWLASCILFWGISRLFGKGVGFWRIFSSWGFSYIPNLICIIAFGVLEMYINSFIGSSFIAVIINTFFIMLLVWKAIYYFLEMKFVMKLNGPELLVTTVITGIVFLGLMSIGSAVGIQIPML